MIEKKINYEHIEFNLENIIYSKELKDLSLFQRYVLFFIGNYGLYATAKHFGWTTMRTWRFYKRAIKNI